MQNIFINTKKTLFKNTSYHWKNITITIKSTPIIFAHAGGHIIKTSCC